MTWIPLVLLTVMVVGVITACTVNPATGNRQLSLVSESQEIALGRQNDQQIVETMGLVDDPELQEYVDRLGKTLAAQSERPDLPWTFRVVDDPVVNAFALPGGFIYVTRGILSHFNSEAELMGVLGHEIGHVTARHSVERISKAQLAQVGLGVGMILEPELAREYGGLAQTGLGLLFLKFGRDDERQADDLGLRYVQRSNYDPREMVDVFEMLGRVSAAQQGGGRLPNWLSTHPAPENRVERISSQIEPGLAGLSDPIVARERYLRQIDGMVFGENPREGYFEGNTFFHPDLAFSLEFPPGWETTNQRQSVAALSPNRDAVVTLSLARENDVRAAEQSFFSQSGVRAGQDLNPRYGNLPASSRAFSAQNAQGSSFEGLASFVEYGGNVYQILGYTLSDRVSSYQDEITNAVGSFRRVQDRSVLNVQPKRIEIVDLPRGMTLREFDQRYPSTVDFEQLLLLNESESGNERLPAGYPVKRIVGGPA